MRWDLVGPIVNSQPPQSGFSKDRSGPHKGPNHMRERPTLVTTTDADLLDIIKAMEVTEKRTRASIVEELLLLGIAARRARGDRVRVDLPTIEKRNAAPSAQGA